MTAVDVNLPTLDDVPPPRVGHASWPRLPADSDLGGSAARC